MRTPLELLMQDNWTGTTIENLVTQEFMAIVTDSYEGEAFPQ